MEKGKITGTRSSKIWGAWDEKWLKIQENRLTLNNIE
jgi:hypothetical protein